jgi:CDP-diacylglycerol---serine O-phosphatidyltransferase
MLLIVKAIPSLLTLSNLIIGLLAMGMAFQGRVGEAALLVVVGMLLDTLDGRAARLLHAESEFGKQLDSLCDLVTFGVAPAFIMYLSVLQPLGLLGMMIAMLFPICGALRLARFNVQTKSSHYFVGLPITAAGGILATMTLYKNSLVPSEVILPAVMLFLALLMVSNVRYPNFKRIAFPRSTVVMVPLLAVVVYVVFRFNLFSVTRLVFAVFGLYALYGVSRSIHQIRKRRKRVQTSVVETEVDGTENLSKM